MGPSGNASGLKGTGYKQVTTPTFSPEQTQLFQQLFGQVSPGSQLSRLAGGDQSRFQELEAPALRQFGQLQGGIASRFSGAGMGARRGSGFQNAQNTAAQEFAQNLQSQRLGLQQDALKDLMNMSNLLLGQRTFENTFVPKKQKKQSFWKQLLLGANEKGRDAAQSFASGGFGL